MTELCNIMVRHRYNLWSPCLTWNVQMLLKSPGHTWLWLWVLEPGITCPVWNQHLWCFFGNTILTHTVLLTVLHSRFLSINKLVTLYISLICLFSNQEHTEVDTTLFVWKNKPTYKKGNIKYVWCHFMATLNSQYFRILLPI